MFLLQPLAPCQDLTSLGDTYTSHSPPSEVPHPGRNVSDSFTGYDTLIVEEACPRISLLSVKGDHMAGHVQVHASTTGVGAIDSVDCKINAVRVFLGHGVHARDSLNFHPHLQGILLGSSSQGG